jgi:hypothetical protein
MEEKQHARWITPARQRPFERQAIMRFSLKGNIVADRMRAHFIEPLSPGGPADGPGLCAQKGANGVDFRSRH